MATRRPASSRARVNNNTNPMPPPQQFQRPKSAISRPPSASAQRSPEDLLESTSGVEPSKQQRNGDDAETHIQVILRCRARSEREMQANSPSIVTIESAKTKELTIETSTPVSSLGIVNLPPTRTYPFDLVFGPEATQSMIYHDVVGPMLKEVIMGYNCTLFAYGQTGTGKTYTMQGDLCPTPMGNPSTDAGIIPRVLFRLFHELEKNYTDFVVKVSFIELYNEELRDLLAPELSAPTTLTQPMGMAAKDAKNSEGGLKIFDDANKRGVFIQGLEEIAVKDSKHALALLLKGSERRQIAATKFNDHSSRSHSVFSLTVHIKETNSMGDDLLKVGKLNLVDLAGSENIGRSGAENKRAREAGMINQSLLTLGRVINALVDKASHVPYRESKLTRLLQDSLGGRTKTCIIGTISPARSNLEETLSTLDYALRAKSIRNKPELNQRMTRNSLLKEYVAEIELLKADLLAAREKNGIYFSEETWNQLNAEHELKATELVEAKKQVEIIENQMRNVRDEYDQSIALLKCREEEIRLTKEKLEETEQTLVQKENELQRATEAYEQEVVVRRAHQHTEHNLDGVAIGLKNVAAQSLSDITGLFAKLDRKQKVLTANNRVVSENEEFIQSFADSLTMKLSEFSQLSSQGRASLQNQTKIYGVAEQQSLSTHMQTIKDHFDEARKLFQQIEENATIEDTALSRLKHSVETAYTSFKEEASSWGDDLQNTSNKLCGESAASSNEQISLLQESSSILSSLVEAIEQQVHTYLRNEQEALSEVQTLAEKMMTREMAHLKRQNELLAQMLVNERKQAEKGKADILQRVSGMLGEFMQKRDDHLKESIGNLQESNREVEEILASTYQRQTKVHGNLTLRNSKLQSQLSDLNKKGLQAKADNEQATGKAREIIQDNFVDIRDQIDSSVSTHAGRIDQQAQVLEQSSNGAFEEYSRAKRARLDATSSIYTGLADQQTSQQTLLASTSKRVEIHTKQTVSWIGTQEQNAKSYEADATANLESIQRATLNLAEKGSNDDTPSGTTPRKRKWQYTEDWTLTKSREHLLQDWRSSRADGMPSQDQPRLVENDVVLPPHRPSEGGSEVKHRRSASSLSENPPSDPYESAKTQPPKRDVPSAEPLIDSRRKNLVRAPSRRLR